MRFYSEPSPLKFTKSDDCVRRALFRKEHLLVNMPTRNVSVAELAVGDSRTIVFFLYAAKGFLARAIVECRNSGIASGESACAKLSLIGETDRVRTGLTARFARVSNMF